MYSSDEINYYIVKEDLSTLRCNTLEEGIRAPELSYVIREEKHSWFDGTHNQTLDIQLFNREKQPFVLAENNWTVMKIEVKSLRDHSSSITLPAMDIADPLGTVQNIVAPAPYYEGVLELHKQLKYISKCPDWEIANQRWRDMYLKKIFVQLKNGKVIDYLLYLNPDEDYEIRLSFERGIFVMRSCITEGNPYEGGSYRDENEFKSEDFYHFMDIVCEKFPPIDIYRSIKI